MRFFSEYVEHIRFVLLLLDPAKKGGTISLVMRWVAFELRVTGVRSLSPCHAASVSASFLDFSFN